MARRTDYDVVVVGGGNAGLCAGLAAAEAGVRVCVLEKAPREWAGGNSYFTAGAFRVAYDSPGAVAQLTDDDAGVRDAEIPPYPTHAFRDDMRRITEGRCDETLTGILVEEAFSTALWMKRLGVRWSLLTDRQSFVVSGRHHFWGGLVVGSENGGQGLIESQLTIAERMGVEVRFGSPVIGLLFDDGAVRGVMFGSNGRRTPMTARAVVMACGGFEASPRYRAAYLGRPWDTVKVRGTPYNTGEGLHLALAAGAQAYGHWSGCHAIAWDAAAAEHGDRNLTNRLSRQSYPFALVVNRDGRRFIDEGADFRNYTYAKYGAEIARQPGAIAFQIFDAKTLPLIHERDYSTATTSRTEASTISALANGVGIPAHTLSQTIDEFNRAVVDGTFDPSRKDGKATRGIAPPKSNWALTLDEPPFVAYAVTGAITFTFGGIRIDELAAVLDLQMRPLSGLFAAGEMVGGLFYHNYPGGSGLSAGSVFGRRAGLAAAAQSKS